MTAQAMHAHGRDVRHGKSGSGSSLNYGPVPGSPTLTNPDMILPDYDCDESLDDRSQSPILMWNNGRTNDMRYHLPPSQNPFVAGPMTPSTPIIYGNGTMLSDIGEVTEVESVVGRGQRRPSSHLSDDDPTMRSMPTMGMSRIKTRSQILSRERRSSLESNSTITSQGHGAPFADFDDSVSVDDINFQGDDEESMASSYVEGTPAQEPRTARVPRTQEVAEQRYSTSSLSDRAEQILANAKQRLTVGSAPSRLENYTNDAIDNGRKPIESKKLALLFPHVRRLNTIPPDCPTRDVPPRHYHSFRNGSFENAERPQFTRRVRQLRIPPAIC